MGLFSKDKNKYLHGFAKTNDSLGKKLKFVTENKKQNKEDLFLLKVKNTAKSFTL